MLSNRNTVRLFVALVLVLLRDPRSYSQTFTDSSLSLIGAGSSSVSFGDFNNDGNIDVALVQGVFQNQPLDYVLFQQRLLDLDIVQFHGSEPVEWARLVPVPVIRSFKPNEQGLGLRGYHALPLLDSGAGGSGKQLDLTDVKKLLSQDKAVLLLNTSVSSTYRLLLVQPVPRGATAQ